MATLRPYLVCTAEGSTSAPNVNVDVENCQVLGMVEANSAAEAIDKLFEQESWIEAAGFSKAKAYVYTLASPSLQ